MKPDISISIGKLKLENPTILASGILGYDLGQLKRVVKNGAGAVTIKSLTMEPREGHNNPILVEIESGFINAVGYTNKGIEKGGEEFSKWKEKTPLIGSIVATDADEFALLAEKLIEKVPVKALEIVLSCPHTPGYGLMGGHGTVENTQKITQAVRRKVTKIPLIVKLSPSVSALGELAKAAENAGADIINMGNTVGPGMKINIERARPILGFQFGGISGPAIKPLMIRCVWDIYLSVKIPVIATGGITTGEDAIEAIMAGATAVGIGTAIYYRGIDVFKKVNAEISDWMEKNKIKNLKEIKGKAHEK